MDWTVVEDPAVRAGRFRVDVARCRRADTDTAFETICCGAEDEPVFRRLCYVDAGSGFFL